MYIIFLVVKVVAKDQQDHRNGFCKPNLETLLNHLPFLFLLLSSQLTFKLFREYAVAINRQIPEKPTSPICSHPACSWPSSPIGPRSIHPPRNDSSHRQPSNHSHDQRFLHRHLSIHIQRGSGDTSAKGILPQSDSSGKLFSCLHSPKDH